jgi:hypothetical protein
LIEVGKPSRISSRSRSCQLIGKTSGFCRFVRSPDAWPNISSISFKAAMSCFCRFTKIAVSSAYKETLTCLRPRSCLIGRPGIPFKRILEDDEARAKLIQSLHLAPKPSFSMTSRRYAQDNESKAFAMSSLMKSAGIFFLCRSLAMP